MYDGGNCISKGYGINCALGILWLIGCSKMLWRFVNFCEVNGLITNLIFCGGNVSSLESCKSKKYLEDEEALRVCIEPERRWLLKVV